MEATDKGLLLTSRIKPGEALYLDKADRLFLAAYSSVASLVVQFSGLLISPSGEVKPWTRTINPTSDLAVTSTTVQLGECFLLSCVAILSTGNANRGQCYVRARAQRGEGTTAVPLASLIAGYVTDDYSPSFPNGKLEGPLEGPGNLRTVTGTNPAAAAEIQMVVPAGARWRVAAGNFDLTTDANAANRQVTISFFIGGQYTLNVTSPSVQAANLTYSYTFAPVGVEQVQRNTYITLPIPPNLYLSAEDTIESEIGSKQAGDDWGTPQLSIEEWIEA